MSDRQSSRTALGAAYARAIHQLFDAQPRILDDPVTPLMLGPTVLQRLSGPAITKTSGLRAHIVLRSRFTEDRLAGAVRRGIKQYVILGAGFDTFAIRQPSWANKLKIIEVDQPKTQDLKRSLLKIAGLTIPANTSFACIDFEHESLTERLLSHHFAVDEPTFFSCLGVMVYLKKKAIDVILGSVAMFPVDSEIVLTFAEPVEITTSLVSQSVSSLAQRVASVGEPFISYFKPEEIKAKLHSAGFSKVEILSAAVAKSRYFRHRPEDLPVPKRTGIVFAIR